MFEPTTSQPVIASKLTVENEYNIQHPLHKHIPLETGLLYLGFFKGPSHIQNGANPSSLRALQRFLGIGRLPQGTETCLQFSDIKMANLEVVELVNRSQVDRSGIGKHSLDIWAAIWWNPDGDLQSSAAAARHVQSRTCFERAPCWCRTDVGRLLKAPAMLFMSTQDFSPRGIYIDIYI